MTGSGVGVQVAPTPAQLPQDQPETLVVRQYVSLAED